MIEKGHQQKTDVYIGTTIQSYRQYSKLVGEKVLFDRRKEPRRTHPSVYIEDFEGAAVYAFFIADTPDGDTSTGKNPTVLEARVSKKDAWLFNPNLFPVEAVWRINPGVDWKKLFMTPIPSRLYDGKLKPYFSCFGAKEMLEKIKQD